MLAEDGAARRNLRASGRPDRLKSDFAFAAVPRLAGSMSSGPVAVIDIGSNTIKLLVAIRGTDGSLLPLKERTVDARISAGIGRAGAALTEDGMARGLDAVKNLLESTRPYAVNRILIVATSAVRDAQNGPGFRERIRAATGIEVRILTGDEEAALIGRGLTTDPALRAQRDFYLFDLGGGSLECLAFRARRVEQSLSLPLGCVRLTECFVGDRNAPFGPDAQQAVAAHTREILAGSTFTFALAPGAAAIGTGGSLTTARAILAIRAGQPFERSDAAVGVPQLRELLTWVGGRPLAERKRIAGLPAARADVFPTALATLIAVAEVGRFSAYHNSLYNLRYGVADEALGAAPG